MVIIFLSHFITLSSLFYHISKFNTHNIFIEIDLRTNLSSSLLHIRYRDPTAPRRRSDEASRDPGRRHNTRLGAPTIRSSRWAGLRVSLVFFSRQPTRQRICGGSKCRGASTMSMLFHRLRQREEHMIAKQALQEAPPIPDISILFFSRPYLTIFFIKREKKSLLQRLALEQRPQAQITE